MTTTSRRPARSRLGAAALMSAVVLVVGAKAASGHGAAQPPAAVAASTASPTLESTGPSSTDSGSTDSGSTGSSSADSGSAGAATQTVTGDAISTRFGNVQVQVVLSDGKITDVVTVQVPEANGREKAINDRAVPLLRQEVLDAQSAQIDTVSGASYTSDGYARSVQSALDQASG